jgi:hypothetical protein
MSVAVWCSSAWNPSSANTRVVTFSACLSDLSAAACAAQPFLQTVVTFDDYPPGLSSPNPGGACNLFCGTSMTEDSSEWSPVIPAITSVSPGTGPITGSTSVTIGGSGLLGATAVDFVNTTTNANVILSVTPSNVTASSLTASTPAITTGSSYYVTVTTPEGTSADTASAEFTYSPVTPTVTGISTSTGAISGGTSVTITGTGFISDATVNFVDTANTNVIVPAPTTNLTIVNGIPTITAVSPGITQGTTYYVTVTTAPGGTSAYNASAEFTYEAIYPVVGGISPSSGPMTGGTQVTITGIGFVTGATVNFAEETGGTAVTPAVSVLATCSPVTLSTEITCTTPAVTAGTTYYVTVTTPVATSANYAIFTY